MVVPEIVSNFNFPKFQEQTTRSVIKFINPERINHKLNLYLKSKNLNLHWGYKLNHNLLVVK